METSGIIFFIGIIFIIVGSITWLVGGVMMVSEAFGVSSGWGWACLFVPFACFVFLRKHWKRACDPFYAIVIGAVMVGVGAMLIDTVEAAATG